MHVASRKPPISHRPVRCRFRTWAFFHSLHLSPGKHIHIESPACVYMHVYAYIYKVKWTRYRPGVAQRVGRGIALLFHDSSTRRGWVVSSTLRPYFTRGRPGTHFTGGWMGPRASVDGRKSRPHRDSIPDRPARSQALYRLSYAAHIYICI